jgi:hypothetical protein
LTFEPPIKGANRFLTLLKIVELFAKHLIKSVAQPRFDGLFVQNLNSADASNVNVTSTSPVLTASALSAFEGARLVCQPFASHEFESAVNLNAARQRRVGNSFLSQFAGRFASIAGTASDKQRKEVAFISIAYEGFP